MTGLKMIGIGRALPGRCVTNDDLSKIVETSDAWISERTGIRRRYYCGEGESTNTLIVSAARQAVANAGLTPEDIDCVIVATVSSDYASPSVACLLQAELGIRENIPVMDINAACAGFLYGTATASGMLQVYGGRYALVVGGEQLSRSGQFHTPAGTLHQRRTEIIFEVLDLPAHRSRRDIQVFRRGAHGIGADQFVEIHQGAQLHGVGTLFGSAGVGGSPYHRSVARKYFTREDRS